MVCDSGWCKHMQKSTTKTCETEHTTQLQQLPHDHSKKKQRKNASHPFDKTPMIKHPICSPQVLGRSKDKWPCSYKRIQVSVLCSQ